VNHAGDLIKKKLIRSNPSPEKALRFSNLYSRLLTQPVLNQKWAILYLLYQLSDSEESGVPTQARSLKSPVKNSRNGGGPPVSPGIYTTRDAAAFEEAFAPGGIRKVPGREGGQTERKGSTQPMGSNAASQREGIALKTALLAANYVEIDPPETTLLRDLPFTLQGLSSTSLPFSNIPSLKLPTTLPPPIISLLHTLAEPSLLYKGLEAFVHSSEPGLLGQSLRAAIGGELRSYLSLVATLETQIRQALSHLNEEMPRGGIGQAGVTLKRIVVWTREATMGLRLLSVIAEESKSQCRIPIS
jgi:gamma-tubulin complex component 3